MKDKRFQNMLFHRWGNLKYTDSVLAPCRGCGRWNSNWQQKAHHDAAEERKKKPCVFLLSWSDCGRKMKWTQEGNVTKPPVSLRPSLTQPTSSAKFVQLLLQGTDELVEIQSNSIWRNTLDSYPYASISLGVIWSVLLQHCRFMQKYSQT